MAIVKEKFDTKEPWVMALGVAQTSCSLYVFIS